MKILPAVYVFKSFWYSHTKDYLSIRDKRFGNESLSNVSVAVQTLPLPATPLYDFARVYSPGVG